jgi:DNA-directed RNA polymerases I and III subunit RPAC2
MLWKEVRFHFLMWRHLIIRLIFIFTYFSPRVAFCGYSMPHPSEKKMHLRIQTRSRDYSASMALRQGLEDLIEVCNIMQISVEDMVSSPVMPADSDE